MAGPASQREQHDHDHDHVATDAPHHDRAWWFQVAVPLAFFVAALILYSAYLDHPDEIVFDEVHYLTAARAFADGEWMNEDWSDDRPHNWEHPPLGKYWMALAIKVFGDDAAEHVRVPSVIYGAAGVAGLSVLAYRLFRSEAAAVVAPLLLLMEPMWFVHSRLAMLEIFVAAPMVWAYAFAFGDRWWEPYAAVGMAALALAAKYSALFLFPVLFLVILWRRVGIERPGRPLGAREALRSFLLVFVAPVVFVFATWAPFLKTWAAERGIRYALGHTWFLFKESLTWGTGGPTDHAEALAPLYWLPMNRPTWYWVHWGDGAGLEQTVGFIYALGNPVIWWGGLMLALIVVVPSVLRILRALHTATEAQHWRSMRLPEADWRILGTVGLALLIFLAGYLPFFLLSRIAFLYYMALLVPYLALIAAGSLVCITQRVTDNEEVRRHAEALGAPGSEVHGPEVEAPAWQHVRLAMERASSSAWTGRLLLGGFVLLALVIAIYWIPLYTGIHVERVWVERAWETVPWWERLVDAPQ